MISLSNVIQCKNVFVPKLDGMKFADLGKEFGVNMVYCIFNQNIHNTSKGDNTK